VEWSGEGGSCKTDGTYSKQQRVLANTLDWFDEEALEEESFASRIRVTHFEIVLELRILLLLLLYSVERGLLIGAIDFVHFKVVRLTTPTHGEC